MVMNLVAVYLLEPYDACEFALWKYGASAFARKQST
jgi:hypothetical protein